MADDRLETFLATAADELPTVPTVAAQIIEALDDPDASLDDVRALIERDPALASRILRVSNSSMYSFPAEVRSLGQAISLVGGRSVKNLVMAVALRETYAEFGPLEQLLWEHSSAAGPVAAALAGRYGTGVDPDECFMVGLLHDIGRTALANSEREDYTALLSRVDAGDVALVAAEREAFGFDHAELGARVAERWKLPPRVVTVIRHHHDPAALGKLDAADATLTAWTAVTDACLVRLGVGRPRPSEDLDVCAVPGWQHLGLDAAALPELLELCGEQVEASAALGG